ncbi:SDR family NAD(P)-dependent oxidoreductase [Haloplasma contractile]|uniref:3-oxoacyl-acyl-carrier protein reductase n=1 Tax=Haloplasma contractile SSD-17B TaxID=1033810 RepID=U2EB26_9MOLU|nr:SDR family oxidoreductase [Haloplasma contractile]ERJ11996.1 3-oxoacyl-acyl-carrier protein reductase [Haloplasma contractile SSD-17B]
MKKLNGKWAFVTGSSRGIGQQIAKGLANHGCNIILHGRKMENTKETIELLKQYDVEVDAVGGELTSQEDIRKIIDYINSKYQIDILYNNAGIQNKYEDIFNHGTDVWQQVFHINLFSLSEFCNAFAPKMKERGYGRIINLSSGIRDIPQMAPYSASKAAVDKYTQDLAFELKDTNVLVNYIDPGWLRTDLGGEWAPNDVTTVLPGILVPALLEDNGPSGQGFSAQDFKETE